MKTKFTPGPWDVEMYAAKHRVDVWAEDELILRNEIFGRDEYKEKIIANVNLIASAPDLYEMVESLADELKMAIDEVNTMRDILHTDNLTPADHWDQESLHDAQVLLAKARGEI